MYVHCIIHVLFTPTKLTSALPVRPIGILTSKHQKLKGYFIIIIIIDQMFVISNLKVEPHKA